ncbi:MAG: hypothetical protein KF838_09405 [Phycisphaeraceae bacterium]|nr:MAG: hypothetical protein KF838_09405 [Phycisphaeraceae bacterium]
MPPIPPNPASTHVVSMLRAHRSGVLLTADGPRPCPTAIDPIGGSLIAPLADPETELESATLFIPEESNDALQVLILPALSAPAGDTDSDRYRAAHGAPDPIRLFRLKIDGARLGSRVVDGPDIDLRDPFASESASLRRAMNADRPALGKAVSYLGLSLGLRPGENPVVIAVDPEGVDLRGPLGVARFTFERCASSAEELRRFASVLLPFDPEQTQV